MNFSQRLSYSDGFNKSSHMAKKVQKYYEKAQCCYNVTIKKTFNEND